MLLGQALLDLQHARAVATSHRIHVSQETLDAVFKRQIEAAKQPIADEGHCRVIVEALVPHREGLGSEPGQRGEESAPQLRKPDRACCVCGAFREYLVDDDFYATVIADQLLVFREVGCFMDDRANAGRIEARHRECQPAAVRGSPQIPLSDTQRFSERFDVMGDLYAVVL